MVCAGFLTPTRLETCIGDAGGEHSLVNDIKARNTEYLSQQMHNSDDQ